MSLVDGLVGVGVGSRVRIRDGDISVTLPSDYPRLLFLFPGRIEQRVRRERIAVRPAVHGDAFDVASRIEAGSAQHLRQLIADVALERLEGSLHEFHASSAMLIAW